MLKITLGRIAYLVAMLSLGFAIYYFFFAPLVQKKANDKDYTHLETSAFFAANLANEKGVIQAVKQYQGKIVVLNFWATWCPPCRDEMPELSQLQAEYKANNVIVLGIAIDEQKLVQDFIAEHPVNYPLLVAENEGMALGSALGNGEGILPYTVMIDANGKVKDTYYGRISKAALKATLNGMIERQ